MTLEPPKNCAIILASASPRRKELLNKASYNFRVIPPDVDESAFSSQGVCPREYAEKLAMAKANNIAEKFPKSLVIGADTVVDCRGQIVGKPADAGDAEQIIRKLFSAPHKVITAVALVRLSDNIRIIKSDSTTVYPKKLTDKQIAEHINSRIWRDKAGAYAIKETADPFIEKIDGSLTNVMGLPMELLEQMLGKIWQENNLNTQ